MKDLLRFVRNDGTETAQEQLDGLLSALGSVDPYTRFPGRVSPVCVCCGQKFDQAAGADNVPAQHAESCAWFYAWKLEALMRMAKEKGIVK